MLLASVGAAPVSAVLSYGDGKELFRYHPRRRPVFCSLRRHAYAIDGEEWEDVRDLMTPIVKLWSAMVFANFLLTFLLKAHGPTAPCHATPITDERKSDD